MTVVVQIPPSNIPVLDPRGYMTKAWRSFFENLLTRAGGVNGGLQPEDPTLDALAALDATAGFVRQTGADAFTKQTVGISATKTSLSSVTLVNGIVTAWT